MKIHVTTLNLVVSLLSLSLAAAASAQLVPTRPVSAEEPERYDNPPAAPRKVETSPRMISRVATYVSYQANVDANGNNILGDAANEPSIAVDPTNPNKSRLRGDNSTM